MFEKLVTDTQVLLDRYSKVQFHVELHNLDSDLIVISVGSYETVQVCDYGKDMVEIVTDEDGATHAPLDDRTALAIAKICLMKLMETMQ